MIHEWLNEGNIDILTNILKDILIDHNDNNIFLVSSSSSSSSVSNLNKNTNCYYFSFAAAYGYGYDIWFITRSENPSELDIRCRDMSMDSRKKNTLLNKKHLIIQKLQQHIRNSKLKELLQ